MKITKLHIKNYKIFDDLELDFTDADGKTLDKIVLVGVNGCGKTTILELIRKIYEGDFSVNDREWWSVEVEFSQQEIETTKSNAFTMKPRPEDNLNVLRISINAGEEFNKDYFARLFTNKNIASFAKEGGKSTSGLRTLNLHEIASNIDFSIFYLPVNTTLPRKKPLSKDVVKVISKEALKTQMQISAIKSIREEIFKNLDMPPRQTIERGIAEIAKSLEGVKLN